MQSVLSENGVGKHRKMSGKVRFAVRGHGRFAVFILTLLLFTGLGRTAETAKVSGEAPESEVWVDVKVKDAERLDEILELKKKVAQLEALEQSLRNENARLTAERNLLKQELFEAINHPYLPLLAPPRRLQ